MKKLSVVKKVTRDVSLTLFLLIVLFSLAACGDSVNMSTSDTSEESVTQETVAAEESTDAASGTEEKVDYAYPNKIVIADNSSSAHLNLAVLADELGLFEEEFASEGIEVETVLFSTGGEINEAIAAGSVDFAFYGDQPAINGIINNVGTTILGSPARSQSAHAILVGADSEIQSVEELAGKKVGVTIGTSYHKTLLMMLEQVGLSEDDIEIVNLSNANAANAVIAGEIDACLITEPLITAYTKSGELKILKDSSGIDNINIFIGRTEFLKQYPEIAVRYIKVLLKAQQWREENLDEAYEIIAAAVNSPVEDVKEYLPKYDMTLRASDKDIDSLTSILEFLQEQGIVTESVDFYEYTDFSYFERAAVEAAEE